MRQIGRQRPAVGKRWRPGSWFAFSFTLMASIPAISLGKSARPDDSAAIKFFEKQVRPLLVANCFTCHSADTNSRGGLRVDDRNGLLVGGGRGAAVVPGKPDESLLIKAVTRAGDLKMPPERPLSGEDIAILKQWIRDGAAWTKVEPVSSDGRIKADYETLRKEHWAWQPLREPHVPAVKDSAWPRDEIDRFLLARMEERGLKPVKDVEKLPLIRRATFDLTGLPPTLTAIDAFLADRSETAFERVVDRLLASPAFGERWGRHWLDVARYGESTGSARNLPYPHAWRYRDYVIDAFNNDKPYDEFLREQIAGDLLPAATSAERAEYLIATGFLALGVKDVNQRFKVRFIMDNIDEQIDTLTRSTLALTESCARCHDHKFDPIPTTDYYALAGIFQSTDLCAALHNKMGGGGLDYYDPQMLLRLGTGAASADASAEKIKRLQQEMAQARAELEALRDARTTTPENSQWTTETRGGPPEDESAPGRVGQTERPGGQRAGRAGSSRCQDRRRHSRPHPWGSRKTRARGSARAPQCCAILWSAGGQRQAEWKARVGTMADQRPESARLAGHGQPRLAPPFWQRIGENRRQFRR